MFEPFEEELTKKGYLKVAGVDEAGRGPLAGPVVAAACFIKPGFILNGVDDSKKLTPAKRKQIFEAIQNNENIEYGLGIVDVETIDRVNILQATMMAMTKAFDELSSGVDFLLVDGNKSPKVSVDTMAVVKGDARVFSIALASVIAKHTRDEIMHKLDEEFPCYGFKNHKGYGTAKHLESILKHGPCRAHRMSFSPISELAQSPEVSHVN